MTKDDFETWVEDGCHADTGQMDTELADLANLDLITYDQKREGFAKAHNIRVSTLDAEVQKRRPYDVRPERDAGSRFYLVDNLRAAVARYV